MNFSDADADASAELRLAQASCQTESDHDFYSNDFDLRKHKLCTGWTQQRMFPSLCESSRNPHGNTTTFGQILTNYFEIPAIHESQWIFDVEPTPYTDSAATHDAV